MSMLLTKRKPREKPTNRLSGSDKRQKCSHDVPATSTQPQQQATRKNLTLADWLLVYAYVDVHPDASQADIVEHFRTRPEGALIFTQGTLSRKLSGRASMEARVNDNPSALSSKRPRVVTRPDVERALILWVRDMEGRGETVSTPMLREKRKIFEDLFQVPEAERLYGDSWVQSFSKAYKIREVHRHEAHIPEDDLFSAGEKGEEEIVDRVRHEIGVASGEIVEIDSDDPEDDPVAPRVTRTRTETIGLCKELMSALMDQGTAEEILELSKPLCQFQARLQRQEHASQKQGTLDKYFTA